MEKWNILEVWEKWTNEKWNNGKCWNFGKIGQLKNGNMEHFGILENRFFGKWKD